MSEHNILGAVLAGGQSRRMGKDKLFLELNNKKLIEHTLDKVKKYLKQIIIITNQKCCVCVHESLHKVLKILFFLTLQ